MQTLLRITVFISTLLLFLFLLAAWLMGLRRNSAQGIEVVVGKERFRVEIAAEPLKWRRGLVGHEPLKQGEGMLFVFPFAGKRSFWMKDMSFPIDIIWIRENKVVGFVDNAQPDNGEARYVSPEPVNMVLEIAAGEKQRLEINIGDAVNIERKR